eukprot:6339503-Amphidinium_carterae.1
MATTRDVSSTCWRHARPGGPVDCVIEPAKPLLLAEVWGPRRPGTATQPSSAAAAAEETKQEPDPVLGQRNKAPPPYKQVQSAPAGPPPAVKVAKAPGGTGASTEVATGATSKSGQDKVPKKPPPVTASRQVTGGGGQPSLAGGWKSPADHQGGTGQTGLPSH